MAELPAMEASFAETAARAKTAADANANIHLCWTPSYSVFCGMLRI